jgi:hypothetical protein
LNDIKFYDRRTFWSGENQNPPGRGSYGRGRVNACMSVVTLLQGGKCYQKEQEEISHLKFVGATKASDGCTRSLGIGNRKDKIRLRLLQANLRTLRHICQL